MRTVYVKNQSILRRLTERIVLVAIFLIVYQAWYVAGVVPMCRVVSGSMAETLLGLHRTIECGDCGFPFFCASDVDPISPRAVCPNCGYAENDLESACDTSGDGILIDKSVLRLRSPRRWEVVAFRHPERAGAIQVKRVVGLPGETVEIRGGDIFIDGKVQRKPLSLQRSIGVVVGDARYEPGLATDAPSRWQGSQADSRWGRSGGEFAHPKDDSETVDWLEYRHWERSVQLPSSKKVEVVETPVTDLSGYNQTRQRRIEEISTVPDLMLSFTLVDWSGDGTLLSRISDGADEFRVEIEPRYGRWTVFHDDQALSSEELPEATKDVRITLSLFDRHFLAAVGQRVVFLPYDVDESRQPTSRPVGIGAANLQVRIDRMRLTRDVCYTRPFGATPFWGVGKPFQLGDDEFFVLGDNSAVSNDSRTWPKAPLLRQSIVGKPLVVHFPCQLTTWGNKIFQVPDIERIRYIR